MRYSRNEPENKKLTKAVANELQRQFKKAGVSKIE